MVGIFVCIYGLRAFRAETSFDIFIDEITYFRLSQNVMNNGWPSLYGSPFHLHPPGYFYLQSLYLQFARPPDDIFAQIYIARHLNMILAAVTGLGIFTIVRRTTNSLFWGVFASLLFAIDAFIIRMNSQVLLDTAALCWVTLGYALLISSITNEDNTLTLWQMGLIGLCFGLGLLTKDMTAFLSVAVLGGMFVTGWYLKRRNALLLISITAGVYSLYIAAVVLIGESSFFYESKLSGIVRLFGINRETGVNRPHGPSFTEKIIEKISEFGMTYLLIALGVLCILILLVWGRRHQRIIAVWAAGAYALLTYSIFFGTLEEQFFYFLIVPCVVVVSLTFARIAEFVQHKPIMKRGALGLLVLFVMLFAGLSTREWILRHFTPNNAYELMYDYIEQTITVEGQIASSSETGQFILGKYGGGPWGNWSTLGELNVFNPRYVLITYDQLEWDFGELAHPMIEWIKTHSETLLELDFPTHHIVLFEVTYD